MKTKMKTIVASDQVLRIVDDATYEGENLATNIDFVISVEGEYYIVDIFNISVEDNDKAQIDSFQARTLEEAVSYVFD